MIAINTDDSKLSAFHDDKGKDLLVNEGFGGDGFGFSKVNDEGNFGMVEIRASGVPTKGSSVVQVKGSLDVSHGTKSKAERSAELTLKPGAKLEVGAYSFEIKKVDKRTVDKRTFGVDPMEITLTIGKELTAIRAFRFFDANGEEVKVNSTGTATTKVFNKITVERSFGLSKVITSGMLELHIWQDLKTTTIPIKLSVGLGF